MEKLKADLLALAEGALKPSQASVQKLVNDLTAAVADKSLSSHEIPQLTSDFYKVPNSAGIPVSGFNAVVSDVPTILTASGASSADGGTIAADLKAIGAEAQKNAQSLQQSIGKKLPPEQ